MRHRRTTMKTQAKTLLAASTALLALATLGACGGEDPTEAEDPASAPGTTESSTDPSGSPEAGSVPAYEPDDYTYVLDTQCYCPLVGPVEVTVEDGEVTSAVTVKRAPGLPKGSDAPDYLRMTINDVIDRANDPKVDEAEITWPAGSTHPTRIALDPIENAIDDEITYVIRDVREG